MAKNYSAWPKGYPKNQFYPQKPVHFGLERTVLRAPKRIAMIFAGTEITFEELKTLADRFATALAAEGVVKGDRVAVHLVNCPQFAVAYYAVMKLGAVFVPLSPLLAPGEAGYQLNDSGATLLITLDLLHAGIAPILPDTAISRVITTSLADCFNPLTAHLKPIGKMEIPKTLDMIDLIREHPPHTASVDIDIHKDLAHILYTGGTTGRPKGVMNSHANVVANVIQTNHWFSGAIIEEHEDEWRPVYPKGEDLPPPLFEGDREIGIAVAPWFHALGLVCNLCPAGFSGTTLVVLPRFDPKEYLDAIATYKPTLIGGAPQLYIPLINHPDFDTYDLSCVKLASSGAAPLPLALIEKLTGAFAADTIFEGYGLTETSGVVSMQPLGSARLGSVGLPLFDTEVKIVGLTSGAELPPGREGEILVKGPQVMVGYYNNPEATAEVLKDGWLHTGDIGKMDEDGYLYITDRLKDLIIYKGYNVYPRELEEILGHHKAVTQCAVVGRPDPEGGEVPVAFVQCAPDAEADAAELIAHVNTQVAAYKKLRDIVFVDHLPTNAVGKVLKRELRNQL